MYLINSSTKGRRKEKWGKQGELEINGFGRLRRHDKGHDNLDNNEESSNYTQQ